MNSIEIRDLNFSYGENQVLKDINLEIKEGEFVVIIGSNGSGKSTFIKNLLGELKPQTGYVEILGKNITDYKDYHDIGYVPQMSVAQKIAFPITAREMVVLNLYSEFGFLKFAKAAQYKKADEILEYLGLLEHKNKPINELSGGLQQRAMIARAMINNPKILILDEPTAGVDEASRHAFLKSIQKLNDDKNLTIILVTHELDEVIEFANVDSTYEIQDGVLVKKFKGGEKC